MDLQNFGLCLKKNMPVLFSYLSNFSSPSWPPFQAPVRNSLSYSGLYLALWSETGQARYNDHTETPSFWNWESHFFQRTAC